MAAIPIIVYAIDVNGNTQSGAKLFTYEAGTTTNRATYTDAALTTPAANPVVCNAAGFAVVYADSSLDDYKLVLKNSAESTTLFQQDNLTTGSVTPALLIYPWLGGDQLLSTTDSPTFAGLTLGNVSFAGVVTDPNADRGMFWDDSAGQVAFFDLGTGLNFNGTTLELDGDLADISGLTPADGAVIIGDGTDFVTESGSTLRTSIGVAIGSDVQAWDADLDVYAANPLTAAELGELQNIGSTTISAAQWGYVGGLDQALATTDSPTFATVTSTSSVIGGVTVSPSGATLGQALGFPNSTSTLEPYTPAGGGDTLAAANETISGNWNYTGTPTISGSPIVSRAATETLSNKTLAAPVITGAASVTGTLDYSASPTVNSIDGDIDFRDYSPDTTGATDCMSALIQACSDASSTGRRLVLPAGKFLLDVSAAETNAVTLSSVADNGSGNGRITTSSAHGFTNGQSVIIMNTEYYDGAWAVSSVTTTTFDITRSYVAETFPSNAYAARGETNMAVLREAIMQGAGGFVAANGASAGDPDTGTVFYITGTGRSPIILNRGAELRDVSFWYPDQVDDLSGGPATVYPHTVVLRDALDGLQAGPGLVALKDVISYNSYHFLRAFSAGGAMGNVSFERVFAYAIRDGYDIGSHLDKFSWNKCYLGIGVYDRATDPNDNTDLASDTYKNGVAIRHKGGDGIWINDSLFYGYADGLLFDGDNDVAFAQMLGSSIDGGKRGIKVTGTGEVNRFSIVGSKFVTSNSGANAEAVPQIYCDSTASPTNPAQWTISSTQFLASEGAHIQIEGSYSVDIDIAGACRFFSPNNTAIATTDAQRASIHINNANASVSVTACDLVGIGGSNKIAVYAQDCSDLTVSENNIGTYNTLIKADASSVDNLVFERNKITPTGSQTYLDGTSHLKGSGYTTLVNQPSYQEDIEYKNVILGAANPIDVTFPRDVIIRNTHNLAMEDAAGTALTVMDVTAADTLRINKKSGNTLSIVDNLSTELLNIGGGNQWNCKVPWNFEDSVDFDTYFQAYSRTDAQLTAGEAVTAGAAGVAYDSDRKSIRVSDGSNWIEPVYVCAQGGGAQSAFSSTSAPGDTYVWSAEVADPDNILASGVVTFPRKGIYDVSATVTWDFDDAGAVSGDIFQLVLLHENSGGTDIDAAKIRVENPASGQESTTVSLITEAASTDTIKLAVRRISGTGSLKPLAGDGQLHTLIVREVRC